MRTGLALAAAAAAVAGTLAQDPVNVQTAPVIGILSVPINATTEPCITSAEDRARYGDAASCFTSFYAKFVESAGGRAVVIPYNANATILDRLFDAVNGILFTGGGADLYLDTPFVRTGKYLFDKVVAAASGPDPVALHATCMGFQMVSIIAANNDSVLERASDGKGFDSENVSWPLDVTADGLRSRLWAAAPEAVRRTLTTQNATLNLHHDGVPPSVYADNPRMAQFLTMVSTNVDRAGKPFVSAWEGANGLPITATQFHPERQYLEYKPGIGANHDWDVVLANRWFADYFMTAARRNSHTWDPALTAQYAVASYAPNVQGDPMFGYAGYVFTF